MKNNKLLAAGVGIGLSGIVLLTSGYTVMADSASGYDVYKSAIKQTKAANSLTADVNVSLTDNGKQVLAVDGTLKNENNTHLSSGNVSITANGTTQALQMFHQDQQMVVKAANSNVYQVFKDDGKGHKHRQDQKQKEDGIDPNAEKVIDALMTNLQNSIQVSDISAGGKEVSLKLSESEISPVVQALGSVLLQNAANHQERPDQDHGTNKEKNLFFKQDLKVDLPKLTQDIVVKQVEAKADITKDNLVDQQTVKLTITGKDASGNEHEVVLAIQADLSHFADTKADTVDLSGKQVQIVQKEKREE